MDFESESYKSAPSVPNPPKDHVEHTGKSKQGLGALKAPFNTVSSTIPSPGSEEISKTEKGDLTGKRLSHNVARGIDDKFRKYSVLKCWMLEIISWLLGALCMGTIIVVLFLYGGKPVPKQWPLSITLNAYIAVLSRAASAALLLPVSEALGQLKWSWFQGSSKKMWHFELFDSASRGPWGSFLLLIRIRSTKLAALAAAITIFMMALDPFFQQVVRFSPRTVLQMQNSTIPKVIRYEPGVTLGFTANALKTEIIYPNRDLTAAVDRFFNDFGVPQVQVGNGTRAEVPLSCQTSNCTWESYETLGVCSECADIADMLDFGCFPAKLDWIQNATSYTPYENGTMCGWFFNATSPSRMLMLGYQVDPATNRSSGEILTTRALPLITNINRRRLFDGSINFGHVRNPITDFVVVSTAGDSDKEKIVESIFRHDKPRALECVVSWCVKTIDSSYQAPAYTETITSRFINTTRGPYQFTFTAPDSGDPKDTGKVQYQDITVDPHATGGYGNVSSYGASNETALSIIFIFDDYLPSFATLANNSSETLLKYQTWREYPYLRKYTKNPWSASENITRHMERLATVMTNIMRQSSNEMALGNAFSVETYIEVRWEWLSLPLTLLVLTLVLLVGTMVRTSMENDRVGVWKNSAIATLVHGLPDDMRQKIITAQEGVAPRVKTKELNVRMLPTKNWRVSGYPLSPIALGSKPPPGWI
ncbi:hypothetical protein BS50DRAFT_502179 [Corynespora cassiicola Philippines]|uniref:DUF3176 domain-containing protein n=1 Tax=Corynespora cassiicola Philippines TaxID=1448308 RepID=A0A2T2NBM9_CORCC|nr:hypothetical protein BS50DRAFT_502179 [Corynespora cassiicola Philippines]